MIDIKASDILQLLENRHSKDVFVSECKTGGTMYNRGMQKLDAWAMARSWARPRYFGYEIKVSRSDFLNDDKWRGYLPYCTDFYFVCPPKLIMPSELPKEAGLMWSTVNAKRLHIKKKAPQREAQIPDSIFRYILMSRSRIDDEYNPMSQREYWAQWLEQRKLDYTFGHHVSKKIREAVDGKIKRVDSVNSALKITIEKYAHIERILIEAGFSKDKLKRGITTYEARRKFSQPIQGAQIEQAIGDCRTLIETLRGLMHG